MQGRVAEASSLAALLLLAACAGVPQTVEDPLAAEACDITRQRIAAAQPGTPETAALAARIVSNCETLGRDYAQALRASALAGAATPIAPCAAHRTRPGAWWNGWTARSGRFRW